MKKLALVAALATSLLSAQAVNAQNSDSTTSSKPKRKVATTITSRNSTGLTERLRRIEAAAHSFTTTTTPPSRIDGSVTRAARSGNPLQMVNPFAPKEYGDGSDVTRRESDDPFQRPQGLRLFAVDF